jgi:5'-deoxy-5'-methylthioadenosine phosphorylase
MKNLAIIGGSGLDSLGLMTVEKREVISTPFGEPAGPITRGTLGGEEILFLPRHGYPHKIPPHKVNYRANLWALHHLGATHVVAVAAVGGIRSDMTPGRIAIPDQIIDYTWGRPSTFFEDDLETVTHIDFTNPYSPQVREGLLKAAFALQMDVVDGGTYGATQGPRLETTAEIVRMERDGCHLVGMTGMPEAALARELELQYGTCAVVANWAAGKGEGEISMAEIEVTLKQGMGQVGDLLTQLAQMHVEG